MARFGTAITCIDGRTHQPLVSWMRAALLVEYVDLVTHPGADAFLAEEPERAAAVLGPSARVSITRHASPVVAVVGHHDCAASPGDASQHRQHLLRAVQAVVGWNLGVKVMALWVNAEWQIEVVQTRPAEA